MGVYISLVVVIYVIVVLWLVSANFRSTLTSLTPRNVVNQMPFFNREDGELESLMLSEIVEIRRNRELNVLPNWIMKMMVITFKNQKIISEKTIMLFLTNFCLLLLYI